MTKIVSLRNFLKNLSGVPNNRVLNSFYVTNCVQTANTVTGLDELSQVTTKDSVNYLQKGFKNIVESCIDSMQMLKTHSTTKQLLVESTIDTDAEALLVL
jgi:hypothetical protein